MTAALAGGLTDSSELGPGIAQDLQKDGKKRNKNSFKNRLTVSDKCDIISELLEKQQAAKRFESLRLSKNQKTC